jgi:hypothetical protein
MSPGCSSTIGGHHGWCRGIHPGCRTPVRQSS